MAEELQIQDQPEKVDQILNETLAGKQYLDRLDQVDRTLFEVQAVEFEHMFPAQLGSEELSVTYLRHVIDSYAKRAHDFSREDRFSAGWSRGLRYLADSQSSRSEEERHQQTNNQLQEEIQKLKAENYVLQRKILLLQAELRNNIPHLQLYRFGAGAFSLSVLSLLMWLFSGVAIPFHQTFALIAIPTSIGFMLMAYLTKKHNPHDTEVGNN